ncbi:hypothetical protein JP75_07770 [Devosia riboflavina]|uniref:Uncharacterized protein n=1 Tax=Devosia riboflavina TaxID=46914 RepID=A0A087M3J0_9HYPH|nr:hypothetical protein [Devosia riboflavina]KFL31443.1 hypothetical protein JP75_07770 [Devosia riboflavina]
MTISDERLGELQHMVGTPADGLYVSLPSSDISAVLTELQSLRAIPRGVVKVKGLEWEQGEASSILGLFSLHHYEAPAPKWSVRLNGTALQIYGDTEKSAQSLAQDYHDDRILSTIEQEQEPVAWRWKWGPTGDWCLGLKRPDVEHPASPYYGKLSALDPLFPSPSVCEGKVTEEMVERALARKRGKDLNTLTNSAAMREILIAALSQEGV